jgi:hypothetical protein
MLFHAILEQSPALEVGVVAQIEDVFVRDHQVSISFQAAEAQLLRCAQEPQKLRAAEEVGVDMVVLQNARRAPGHVSKSPAK